MSFLDYKDPIITRRRSGSSDNPFISISESHQIENSKVNLTEIPSELDRVIVTGESITWIEKLEGLPSENEYVVDYVNGLVTFHHSRIGLQLQFDYKGTGLRYVPTSMIYSKVNNGEVTETLHDIISNGNTAIEALKNVEEAVQNAKTATTEANNAAELANEKANLAETKTNEFETAEILRESSENIRIQNESARELTEINRNDAETIRISNEENRKSGETLRITNESERVSNETLRQQQEQKRQTDSQLVIDNVETATQNANTKAQLADEKATLAQQKVDSLSELETNINQAITNSQSATSNANTSASEAQSQSQYAKSQGDYAKAQGDYAKRQGDSLQDIIDGTGLIASSEKGRPDGVATLDGNGKVPLNQLPDISQEKTYIVQNETERLTLTGLKSGDRCYERESGNSYIHDGVQWHIQSKADWENVNLDWNNIFNRPTSTQSQIDNAVSKAHSHSNKDVLDKITQSGLDMIDSHENRIQSLETDNTNNKNKIGFLNELQTVEKGSLVGAINEVKNQEIDTSTLVTKTEFSEHQAEDATGAHKAENISFADVNITATNVKDAILQAFTLGNSRKEELVDVLLLVDPSLPITYESTWDEVITASGQINTGKKYASGTVTSSSTATLNVTTISGGSANSRHYVTVTGLTFKPSSIKVTWVSGTTSAQTIYQENTYDYYSPSVRMVQYYSDYQRSDAITNHYKGDVNGINVTPTSFVLPVNIANSLYHWEAFE